MNTIEFSQNGIGSISKALVALRAKFKPLKKGTKNDFFKSNYASLDDVLDSVSEALTEADIAAIQGTKTNDDGSILIETLLLHGASAEWVSTGITLTPLKAPIKKDSPEVQVTPQTVGSAITYGRRYTLQAILAIAAEDDDGNAAAQSQPAGSTVREYKLQPLPQGTFPANPSTQDGSEGEWVEGLFGPVNQSDDGKAWFSSIAGQRIYTQNVQTADSMRATREKVRAHIRKKLPTSKAAQLLSFMPLSDDLPDAGLIEND